ncbi:hypothetical protein ODJ79_34520 [Actinoplanes sp. KI2]|uniref:hypothetical protein n=1 Tax=Actinoplanes sp. KI2 TaxID=2983315 RepID=UPI0021D58C47|nr:hypothetical protein [Actinoplanes sp. KI2]MCU7728855.1 hypothetical protein [Actinoplanes sp. KI2]
MSAGGIVVLPMAAVLAAGAVVVLTAAAAAALTVWAVNQAAEAALRALGEVGQRLENEAERQSQAEIAALRWPHIAAEVVEVNARIRLLAERASRTGVVVAVPAPLNLDGCTEQQAVEWAARARVLLVAANDALATAGAATERERLAASLPRTVSALPDTAAALSRLQDALRNRRPGPAPAVARPAGRGPDVDAILRTLDADVNENERFEALEAAARARTAGAGTMFARQLQMKVADVNGRAARRRLAAQLTGVLEEPVVVRTPPPAPYTGTAAKLRAVVAGDADLTPELLREGAGAVRWAEGVVRANLVRETVSQCLADQGYTVDGTSDLHLTRTDWQGEHSAEVWIDEHNVVHGRVVRDQDVDGDEAAMRDRDRCDGFNADLAELADRLDAEVVIDHGHVPQRRGRTTPETPIARPRAREAR